MNIRTYLGADVRMQPRWEYDLSRLTYIALITVLLVTLAPLSPISLSLARASLIAAIGYFAIGKILVAIEVIPHGAHKSFVPEALHWIGELALCALVPVLLISGAVGAIACLALYILSVVATPSPS